MIWVVIIHGIAASYGTLVAAEAGNAWVAALCGVLAGLSGGIALVKIEEVMP